MERFHAWGQYLVVLTKGFQGGLVFTKRKKIEPDRKNLQYIKGVYGVGYKFEGKRNVP